MAAAKKELTVQELVDKRRELVEQLAAVDAQIRARHGEVQNKTK